MDGFIQNLLGSGIKRFPRINTDSLFFQFPDEASDIYPALNLVCFFFACNPSVKVIRFPDLSFSTLLFLWESHLLSFRQ